jgi:hypothetical protein
MKYTHLVLISLCLPLFVAFAGCSSKPTEQLALAQKAMDQAKEQYAQEFAQADWKSAQQAWEDAQSLITKEQYAEAGTLLLRAKSRFEKARDIAASRREDLRREIDGIQKTIDTRYGRLKAGLSAAKLPAAVKKRLDESCLNIDTAVQKLKTELEQGDYTQAKDTAQTTMRQVYEAEKEVEKAGRLR